MKKGKNKRIKWLKRPQPHDYPAAHSFLLLIYDEETTSGLLSRLKRAPVMEFEAKDIARAARLPLLDVTNPYVIQDRKKIKRGESLSPVLLVRDTTNGKVIIADGYHRICAVHSFDENAVIPCKII